MDIIEGDRKPQGSTIKPMRPFLTYLPTYPIQVRLALGFDQHPPCPVDQPLKEVDRLGSLEVLHAPGTRPAISASGGRCGAP